MLNKVSIVGKVKSIKDAFKSYTGKTIVNFYIDLPNRLKGKSNNKYIFTRIHCVSFGKVAELFLKYAEVGMIVGANGFLQNEISKEGVCTIVVVAEEVSFYPEVISASSSHKDYAIAFMTSEELEQGVELLEKEDIEKIVSNVKDGEFDF